MVPSRTFYYLNRFYFNIFSFALLYLTHSLMDVDVCVVVVVVL